MINATANFLSYYNPKIQNMRDDFGIKNTKIFYQLLFLLTNINSLNFTFTNLKLKLLLLEPIFIDQIYALFQFFQF